jgi:two-component system phosphate regulon sensor histidine kinase PhoR
MARLPAPVRLVRVLGAALLIGAVPSLVIAGLLVSGFLPAEAGLVALCVIILGTLGVARIWIGNLTRLAEGLRRAAEDDTVFDRPQLAPLLPAVEEIADGVSRLARRLAERAEQVMRLRRADEAIVENLPDPLLVLAPNRQPLRANAAARALFGLADSRDTASAGGPGGGPGGGDVPALLRHPVLAGAVDRALAEGRAQAVDVTLPVPVARELAVRAIPMDPPLADGGRIVVLLADRSRERAVERMRADFVANASHELRTPLASLIGFIETLRGPAEDDPAARARFLGIMAEQSERMRRLIDDLLGLSRIELSEHQPPTGRACPARIVRAEVEALAPTAQARGAAISLDLDEAALAGPADAEQVAQIARNLIENALRHGRPGGQVTVSVTRSEPGADRRLPARSGVVLTVADDGPGIAREHLPRLTERFYRVDKGRNRSAGGTGLGLAIVKHIVNRHRGVLLIDSREGEGSVFRVWLPAAPPGEAPSLPAPMPPAEASRAPALPPPRAAPVALFGPVPPALPTNSPEEAPAARLPPDRAKAPRRKAG